MEAKKYTMPETNIVNDVVINDYSQVLDRFNKTAVFLKNEFIHGGHWLSLGGAAFAISIMLMLNTTFNYELILIIYLLCLFVYSFDHYISIEEDKEDNPERTEHLEKYKKLFPMIAAVYGSLLIGLLWYYGNVLSLLIGILILSIGILYSIGLKNLTKKIVGFKNIYTSFSVSLLVILISFHIGLNLNLASFVIAAFIFLRLFINSSFCDLKDIRSDKKKNLKTFPIYFGKKKFLLFLHVLHVASLLCIVMGIVLDILPFFTIFLLFSFPIVLFYLDKAKNTDVEIEHLSSKFVDGEFILWPLFLFCGKFIVTLI
ncbi:MAG: UbiA family prenyltransferase [Candidatus Thermoplasmatota archaeon]